MLYGLDAAQLAFAVLDPGARFLALADEGVWRDGGPVLDIEGEAAALLSAERTALNLLQRLSGVATLTARYVEAVRGTRARVLDTRKTTPGLRMLEKAAVAAGGGTNHRIGLFDAVLIKENHAAMAGGVGEAVRKARASAPQGTLVEVECRDDAEVDEALAAGAADPARQHEPRRRCGRSWPAWTAAPSSRPAAGSTWRRSGTSQRPG